MCVPTQDEVLVCGPSNNFAVVGLVVSANGVVPFPFSFLLSYKAQETTLGQKKTPGPQTQAQI